MTNYYILKVGVNEKSSSFDNLFLLENFQTKNFFLREHFFSSLKCKNRMKTTTLVNLKKHKPKADIKTQRESRILLCSKYIDFFFKLTLRNSRFQQQQQKRENKT